jgi:signal transduction histidine kinase
VHGFEKGRTLNSGWFYEGTRCLAFLLILFHAALSPAQTPPQAPGLTPFALEGNWSGSLLGRYFLQFASDDRSLDINAALTRIMQGGASRSQQDRPNFGPSPAAHFAYFTIYNPDALPRTVVLENLYPVIDHFILYALQEGSPQEILHAGDQASFANRSYHAPNINKEWVLQPGLNAFLIKTWGDNCVQIPLKLWDAKDFQEKGHTELLVIGILLGFHLVMIIYNLFLYGWVRDRVYLYYVGFVFSNVIYQMSNLNLGQYFFHSVLGLETYPNGIQLTSVDFIIIAGLHFTRSYHALDYQHKYRWANRIMQASIGMALLDIVMIQWFSIRISSIVVLLNSTLCISLLITIGLISWKSGYKPARYFLLGWTFYLLGSFDVVLVFLGYVEATGLSTWSQLLGGAIEVSLFSLAIGGRYMAMQDSLYLAETKRAEFQQTLSQELQTRFHLMSDLSHRINNPLNHIATHITNLQTDLSRHEAELMQLLRASMDESDEANTILSGFASRLKSLQESACSVEQATLRTSETIKEIRTLSGVDGYNVEACDLLDIVEKCQVRLKEICGSAWHHRLILQAQPDATKVYSNEVALIQSIVSVLASIVKDSRIQGPIHVELTRNPESGHRLCFSAPKAQVICQNPSVQKALDFSRHLLKPYSTIISFEETAGAFRFSLNFPGVAFSTAA